MSKSSSEDDGEIVFADICRKSFQFVSVLYRLTTYVMQNRNCDIVISYRLLQHFYHLKLEFFPLCGIFSKTFSCVVYTEILIILAS